MQLLSRRMVHLVLVLILGTCTISCSQVQVKAEYECSKVIGRGLRRPNMGEVHTTLLDIADDFTYKDKKNFTLNHFLERINIYNEEEFDYEIDRIRI